MPSESCLKHARPRDRLPFEKCPDGILRLKLRRKDGYDKVIDRHALRYPEWYVIFSRAVFRFGKRAYRVN